MLVGAPSVRLNGGSGGYNNNVDRNDKLCDCDRRKCVIPTTAHANHPQPPSNVMIAKDEKHPRMVGLACFTTCN